jgi:glycosyltransferase involved in cell wall biosynthesis
MISIIVPAYNASRTLPACLTALKEQTRRPDEIIVVDDGSNDLTSQVVLEYGANLLGQSHQGPAAARNLGITKACGDIILFTDSDCVPVSTWIAEMVRPFEDPQIMGVKGSYRSHQREQVARLAQIEFEERYDLLAHHKSIDFIDTHAAGFRADILRSSRAFDPAFTQNEDVDLSYRLANAGCRMVFNREAVVYHMHPSTWKAYFLLKIKRGYWRMMAYQRHPDKVASDSYTPQLLKVQIALIYLLLGFSGLAFVIHPMLWGVLATLIVFCLSAFPFIKRTIRQDRSLMVASLNFVFVRAFAFAIGVVGGIFKMIFLRPSLIHKNSEK